MKENQLLKGDTVEKKNLENLYLRYEVFTNKTFIDTNFARCKLLDITFENCSFKYGSFSGCDFDNVLFRNCKFKGFNFSNIQGTIKIIGCYTSKLRFTGCMSSHSYFTKTNFRGTTFILCCFGDLLTESCNLINSRFQLTDITNSKFTSCNLTGSVFYSCNLGGCRFRDCNTNKMSFLPISRLNYEMFVPFQTGFNVCRIIPSVVRKQGFMPKLWRHELATREAFRKKHMNFRNYHSIFKRIWENHPPPREEDQQPQKLDSSALKRYLNTLLNHQFDLEY